MKTIFISAFEGVEAKNILRTGILATLLSRQNVRLVLLMKNQDRVNLYKKEFNNPRIIYEVVPYSRDLGRGFDRIFAFLKFILLRTETKDLQRRLAYEDGGSFFVYFCGGIANWLLARGPVRRAVRFLDFLIVRNDIYAPVFDKHQPDLVFLAHLFEEPEIHILREAKRRGIKSIGFINSWDKITARCVLRILPDKAVVFNDASKDEMARFNDMNPQDIFAGGIPQYDTYFTGPFSERKDFFKKTGLNPEKKMIVYAPMGAAFSSSDWEIIDILDNLINRKKVAGNAALLIRFQPNDFFSEAELKKRPHLVFDYPGIRFSSKRGVDWDMNVDDIAHLRDTLFHASLLICYASSMSVDAAVFGKPVININFEIGKASSASKLPTKFYKMTHYKKALATGGIRLVNCEAELEKWIADYLADPAIDKAKRENLAAEQCKFTDGKAGERIGKFILGSLNAVEN